MRPLLVGEANPYGGDPYYALFPFPENSAGGRLCHKVLGLSQREYLSRFDRANLCATRWRAREARNSAIRIEVERAGFVAVLFGAKVARAFGLPFTPFEPPVKRLMTFVVLPHPSGRCRAWNEPGAFDRARTALRAAGALP